MRGYNKAKSILKRALGIPRIPRESYATNSISKLEKLINLQPNFLTFLDSDFYHKYHVDVEAAGLGAIEHFLEHGFKERRLFLYNENKLKFDTYDHSSKQILFITAAARTEATVRYRCHNNSLVFNNQGYKTEIISAKEDTLIDIIDAMARSKVVVFCRPCFNFPIQFLVKIAKVNGIKILFEMDDALFPWYSADNGIVQSQEYSDKKIYTDRIQEFAFASVVDGFIVSTESLKKELSFLNKPTLVANNVVEDKFFSPQQSPSSDKIKILYSSGTATHRGDLTRWILPFLDNLDKDRMEIGMIGKYGNYGKAIENIVPSVKYHDFCPYSEMIKITSEYDLLFVPLIQNRFNNCKSAIKFLEAASVGVPTLATNTDEFARLIKNNETGFIFSNERELANCIKNLRKSKLKEVGKNAQKFVREQLATSSYRPDITSFFDRFL